MSWVQVCHSWSVVKYFDNNFSKKNTDQEILPYERENQVNNLKISLIKLLKIHANVVLSARMNLSQHCMTPLIQILLTYEMKLLPRIAHTKYCCRLLTSSILVMIVTLLKSFEAIDCGLLKFCWNVFVVISMNLNEIFFLYFLIIFFFFWKVKFIIYIFSAC